MNLKKYKLDYKEVRKTCNKTNFKSLKKQKKLEEIVGQERAVKSLDFGIKINAPGYNIYVGGEEGTGKKTLIKSLLTNHTKDMQVPIDQCLVYNFKNHRNPNVIELESGKGNEFKSDIELLIEHLNKSLPSLYTQQQNLGLIQAVKEVAYNNERKLKNEYNKKLGELGYGILIEDGHIGLKPVDHDQESIINFIHAQKTLFKALNSQLNELGLILVEDGLGHYIDKKDSTISDENFVEGQELLEKYQESSEILAKGFVEDSLDKNNNSQQFKVAKQLVREYTQKQSEIIKKYKEKVILAKKLVADRYLSGFVTNLSKKYENNKISNYLLDFKESLLKNLGFFLLNEEKKQEHSYFLDKYKINVIVDNSKTKGAPIIFEPDPTYENLFGSIERIMSLSSGSKGNNSHLKVNIGSFCKANGGYIIIDAWKALQNRNVWESLVCALENKCVRIHDGNEFYSSTIKTKSIKADTKVVLVGGRYLKYLMQHYLPEFNHLFKVKADFSSEMNYSEENVNKYYSFIHNLCDKESLLHLNEKAVSAVVEYGMRLVDSQKKQSTNFGKIADLIREADYWTRLDNKKTITQDYIEKAQSEKIFRSRIIEEKIHEYINDGIIKIKTDGEQVGQINGLAVYSYPDNPFGIPTRITAVTSVGKKGLINIEERCELSGEILNKSAEIIYRGVLKGRFAQNKNISLDATICFEQTYNGVDGDSASIATLCAIYSHLSQLPINQQLAVTGSLDQFGNAQAIGGVNEKIEGFYYTCKDKGLTGDQGVVIPKDNINDLMLNKEVTNAIKNKKFHIYAVESIDQAAEILMNKDSKKIYNKINNRLIELSEYHKDQEDK